jgi:hypothetical protein
MSADLPPAARAGAAVSAPGRRAVIADVVGLIGLLLVLLDYLRPSLLLLDTITAGGDTPCHYPTAVWFHEHLLPRLRLHGWYPGAYLGHPLLLYYFPLPFLVMSAFAPWTGMPVAFKLGTVLGVFLLPLLSYVSFRLMGLRFPAPLFAAGASTLFLFLEENPIWGGTLASTLTGEFSYTYGIGLGVLFLGVAYRAYSRGSSPWLPAGVLAVTALAHGYAVLWAGLSTAYFLYSARRPWRTFAWLAGVAAGAFAFVGFQVLPLLADWKWTTPYDDPWITVTTTNLVPSLIWPLLIAGAFGLAVTVILSRRTGGPDHRLLFLGHAALVGAALAAAGPALGVIDVRFVPFAQLAGCLLGAAALGIVLQKAAAPDLAAIGLVLLMVVHGDSRSRVLRHWIDWNYLGLEAKDLWPAFRALTQRIRGTVGDPRVAVEYSPEHEKAGSIRMYETLPLFSGRSTLEGVYNQASLQTHAVYYLASELGATSPNPFRNRSYSRFDTENALRHLRLFNVREVVALSPQLITSLEARSDVADLGRIPPYAVFRLREAGGYVEPLAFAPVRSAWDGWRDKSYRWFSRKPTSPAHLVFTDDRRFDVLEKDEWLPPPLVPLPAGVEVQETVEPETITIRTNRPGHPLLVKVSYHPRWRAEGADGPYLVSPALMMVVPRSETVRLVYARTWSDALGLALSLGAIGLLALRSVARRRAAAGGEASARSAQVHPVLPDACSPPATGRRWGWIVPAGLVVMLAAGRFVGGRGPVGVPVEELYERASRAYAAERFEDAAEYARHALSGGAATGLVAELQCLRGESLLRAGRAREAVEAFDAVVQDPSETPYRAQALFGAAQARAAAGDASAAEAARERLLNEFGDTPWAMRLRGSAPAQP